AGAKPVERLDCRRLDRTRLRHLEVRPLLRANAGRRRSAGLVDAGNGRAPPFADAVDAHLVPRGLSLASLTLPTTTGAEGARVAVNGCCRSRSSPCRDAP